jgi:hypothetical protein
MSSPFLVMRTVSGSTLIFFSASRAVMPARTSYTISRNLMDIGMLTPISQGLYPAVRGQSMNVEFADEMGAVDQVETADASAASRCSSEYMALKAAMAIASISSSGSAVVMFCSHRFGAMRIFARVWLRNVPVKRMYS